MARRITAQAIRLPMRVWDLPVRLFHWLIVALVVVSYVSIKTGRPQLHLLTGFCVLALLLFRLAWGFVGSDTARFGMFVRSPLAGLRHLVEIGRREPDNQIGHNEAGGWMVLALLGALAVQVATGLCAHTRSGIAGPLAGLVGPAWSTQLSRLHGTLFNVLLALIGLHVLAVAAFAALKGQNLLRPMITGKKMLPAAARAPRLASPLLAAAILVVAALVVALLATRA